MNEAYISLLEWNSHRLQYAEWHLQRELISVIMESHSPVQWGLKARSTEKQPNIFFYV